MKRRCYYADHSAYKHYGGRGITICKEWIDNSDSFVKWAISNGWKRELEIDRIDNNGSYSPENCRWVTPSENQRNTRANVTNFEKGTRICYVCKVEKLLTEFHRSNGKVMGRRYICKDCRKLEQEQELYAPGHNHEIIMDMEDI